jgi:preprotein translocase subunit YajC
VIAASSSWNVLTALLPFVLLFGFWTFLMRQYRTKQPPQGDQVLEKLEEIRVELERLRKSLDEQESGGFGFRS